MSIRDLIDAMASAMSAGCWHKDCEIALVLLKEDDDDPGGLSVEFSRNDRPVGYMHPEDFKAIWDAAERGDR